MSTIISKLEEIKFFVKDDEDYYIDEQINTQARTFLEKLGVIKNYIDKLKIHEETKNNKITEEKGFFSKLGKLMPSIYTKSDRAQKSKSESRYDDLEVAREKEEADQQKRSDRKEKKAATDSKVGDFGTMFNIEEEEDEEREERTQERKEQERKEQERKRKAAEEERKEQERKRKAAEEERKEQEAEQERKRKAAEVNQKIEDAKNAAAEKRKEDDKLLVEANAIDFTSKSGDFETAITGAKNKESVEESLSEAEEYFKNKKARLNEISENISDTSKKALITKIIEHLNSVYHRYRFEAKPTVRIAELKIKEEERKLWSTEGFNDKFQLVWAEFKTVYEEKIPPELIMHEDSKKFIEQFKTLIMFFSTCDNHLLSIIKNIESIQIKARRTPHPFASTLIVFNKIKYIFGYSEPKSDSSMRGSYARDHTIQKGNAFVLKFFEFFRKIMTSTLENNDIFLSANLASGTGIEVDIKIALSNLTTWLGEIYNEYITVKKRKTERIGPVKELNDLDKNIHKNIPGDKKVITFEQENMLKTYIRTFISEDVLNLMKQKFFLTSDSTIPSLPELLSTTSEKFKRIFTIAPITPAEIGNVTRECKPSTSIILGGNKTKKLKRKQIFRKTHKNIYSHNNGTTNRFHRGQHRSRKNNHIHKITVRKH